MGRAGWAPGHRAGGRDGGRPDHRRAGSFSWVAPGVVPPVRGVLLPGRQPAVRHLPGAAGPARAAATAASLEAVKRPRVMTGLRHRRALWTDNLGARAPRVPARS